MPNMSSLDLFNISEAEEDPFGNIEQDIDKDFMVDVIENFMIFYQVSQFTIHLLLAIAISAANLFVIYLFCRCKRLRSRMNLYILICSILDLLKQLEHVINFVLSEICGLFVFELFCLEDVTGNSILGLYLIFGFGLALDWFVSCYKPYLVKNVDRYFKFVVSGLLAFAFILTSWKTVSCTRQPFGYMMSDFHSLRITIFLTFSVALLIINILTGKFELKRANVKTSYALTVANIVIYSYCPILFYHLVVKLFPMHYILEIGILYTLFIPEMISNIQIFLILNVLRKQSKDFHVAFASCCKKSSNDYEEDNLNDNSDDDEIKNTYVHTNSYVSNDEDRTLIL